MKRRELLVRSAGVAFLLAAPFGVVATARGTLLEEPKAWIGTTFRLTDGSRLQLAAVETVAGDHFSTQLRLHFRTLTGSSPGEGTHVLAADWGEEMLFLQTGSEGPVACVNRLCRSV